MIFIETFDPVINGIAYSELRIASLFISFSNEMYYYRNVLKGVEKMIRRKLLGVDFFSRRSFLSFSFDEWL